jgi:hypothetical protein
VRSTNALVHGRFAMDDGLITAIQNTNNDEINGRDGDGGSSCLAIIRNFYTTLLEEI